jgi:hypothetical protein
MARTRKIQIPGEEVSDTITDISIEKLIPNYVGGYIVAILDGHHTILMSDHATGTHWRAWRRTSAGIFSNDVLNFSRKKSHGKYVLIKRNDETTVARIITDEEKLQFETLKLVDGQIKDRPYMILKKLQKGEKLVNTQRYITENTMEPEESILNVPSAEASQDDDLDQHVGSISLFTE